VSADDGVATVWAAAAMAVLTSVLAICLHLGSAVLARHRAESAADLAALAGAREAVRGEATACRRAAAIAAAAGGGVVRCRLVGWSVLVEVRVPVPFALPGLDTATGQAMAGPDPVGQPRFGERSMDTAGRADTASAAFTACTHRSKHGSALRQRARRCSSTNRRRTLVRCAGARPTGTGSRPFGWSGNHWMSLPRLRWGRRVV
jgi:secretion/DNA translocation related TadE-like protein